MKWIWKGLAGAGLALALVSLGAGCPGVTETLNEAIAEVTAAVTNELDQQSRPAEAVDVEVAEERETVDAANVDRVDEDRACYEDCLANGGDERLCRERCFGDGGDDDGRECYEDCLANGGDERLCRERCFGDGGDDDDGDREGACCMPDGTCVMLAEDDCVARRGTYAGDGTNCRDTDCDGHGGREGACCLPDGTCVMLKAVAAASTASTSLIRRLPSGEHAGPLGPSRRVS